MGEEEHINLQSSALGLTNHTQPWQLQGTEPLLMAGLGCRSLSAMGTRVTTSVSPKQGSSLPPCHAAGDWCEKQLQNVPTPSAGCRCLSE